ncbi:MAG: MATE family efflux transporter [Desulfuromonadaceae bacterium]|nr:MATE family efflux transporter [Desulfuromonadaceae bacterium]
MIDSRLYKRELFRLLQLSIPLTLAQLAQSSMGFVDTMMAGRVSAQDLAAVAIGSSLWFPLFLFLLGLLSALTPLVAQANGARDRELLRHLPLQGLYLGFGGGTLLGMLLPQANVLLPWLQVDNALTPLIVGYLKAVSWGFPAIGACFALRHCCEGLALSRPSMIVSFCGLGINIIANTLLVFGKLGFPALGGIGCGVATAITMWIMLALMILLFLRLPQPDSGSSQGQLAWRPSLLRQVLKLGLPIGCGMFIECSAFAVIALLISRFGATQVAAHQIALNFASMIFMIPLSLGNATAVRVGYSIGRQRRHQIYCSAWTGISTALVFSCFSFLAISVFPELWASLYTTDSILLSQAAALLQLAALFQLPDAFQVSCAGALRGCKDTRIPLLLQICAYWLVSLPCGCWFGLVKHMEARGFWIGLICGLCTAALMLGWRLHSSLRRITATR